MKCLNCGKELTNKQQKYCSNACQREYQSQQVVNSWLAGEFNGISGQYELSKYIRNYLLKKANYQCEQCGWHEINPFTQKIPLEIHHKDGQPLNNTPDNLQVLCPNCHALTPNFKNNGGGRPGRISSAARPSKKLCVDCGAEIFSTSTRCRSCEAKRRKMDKPISREELKQLIRTQSFVAIGKQFLVADNTIRKWCQSYNLPHRKKDINSYSDEEWKNV